jgi:hypothetical protein
MKERRDKVEEIKKKTNYYSTRDLIQRYDEGSPATPLRPRVNPGQPLPVTPQQRPPQNNVNTNTKAVNPALQAQLSRTSIFSDLPQVIQSFFQLSRLFLCSLNGDNGMIGSLTRSWATTTPILPLQVLVMP